MPNLLLGLALGIAVYRFAANLWGRRAATAALALYVLSPNIIAHASLATLDVPIACFTFLTVYALWLYAQRPHWSRMLILSLALGAALATKIQAFVLVPLIAGVLIALAMRNPSVRPSRSWLLLGAVPWVCINAVYLNMPLRTGLLLPPAYLAALGMKLTLAQNAWDAYLLGQYSTTGWWYYFPLAVLIKTPIPTLVLLCVGIANRRAWPRAMFLIVPAAGLLAVAMAASLNIGLRHVLTIYPFLFMLAGYGAAQLWHRSWRGAILIGLAGWCVCDAVLIAPHHLSYFNVLAGGPRQGHRVLADSNYDWGQNDRELRRYIARRGLAYQINPDPFHPTTGHILVNANALYGLYGNGRSAAYAWLKRYTPVNQIAYTWFEYDVPKKPAATEPAAPTSPVDRSARLFRPWDERRCVPERNATLVKVAAYLRALRDENADVTDREFHRQLALAFIGVAAYDDCLAEVRRMLAQDPADEEALGLGGEVMVRWKLGLLNFEGEEYLDGFGSDAAATDAVRPNIPHTVRAARLTGVQSLVAAAHAALADALNRQARPASAAGQMAAARTFDPSVQSKSDPGRAL